MFIVYEQVSPVPVMVSPSYMMAKSKNKIVMHIKTDHFFEPPEDYSRYVVVLL